MFMYKYMYVPMVAQVLISPCGGRNPLRMSISVSARMQLRISGQNLQKRRLPYQRSIQQPQTLRNSFKYYRANLTTPFYTGRGPK